jgi:hypothetical protein
MHSILQYNEFWVKEHVGVMWAFNDFGGYPQACHKVLNAENRALNCQQGFCALQVSNAGSMT